MKGYCRQILAVELNASLCKIAEQNLVLNGISNVKILNCDSQRFAQMILKRRVYVDPLNGNKYSFEAVLVDPPRCGLDPTTCALIAAYPYIIYISCGMDALMRDLRKV